MCFGDKGDLARQPIVIAIGKILRRQSICQFFGRIMVARAIPDGGNKNCPAARSVTLLKAPDRQHRHVTRCLTRYSGLRHNAFAMISARMAAAPTTSSILV